MNTAGADQLEARVMLSSGLDPLDCPPVPNPPFIDVCSFVVAARRHRSGTRSSTASGTARATRTSARSARAQAR